MKSKKVNEFNVNDKIRLCGYDGVVVEVHEEERDSAACTYLKVKFSDDCDIANTAYDCGWYGGTNSLVSYGIIE